jgi:hypothetical protein
MKVEGIFSAFFILNYFVCLFVFFLSFVATTKVPPGCCLGLNGWS